MSLLGVEVFAVSTEANTSLVETEGGDTTAMPLGFVARMERPHEVDTPDRDW